MGKLRKLGHKTLHMSEFVGHFSEIFRRPLGGCFVIPLMFFDALEVPGPSQSDPGSIWGTSFFNQNFLKKSTLYVDLVSSFTAPRINSFEQTQCDSKSKQLI